MLITYKYGIGYGTHISDLETEDDATDEDIESTVEQAVVERLDWSWKKEPQ